MNIMQAPNVGPAGRDFGCKEPVPVARSGYVWCKCKCCGDPFQARIADRKRGWGRFCSKSCKAIKQEQRTGQYAHYLDHHVRYPHDDNGHLIMPSSKEANRLTQRRG